MPALAELTGKMVFLPLPYVTLCHFFLQTPYSLCYSLKIGKTKALNRRIFICVYGCLSISHYHIISKEMKKFRNYSFADLGIYLYTEAHMHVQFLMLKWAYYNFMDLITQLTQKHRQPIGSVFCCCCCCCCLVALCNIVRASEEKKSVAKKMLIRI